MEDKILNLLEENYTEEEIYEELCLDMMCIYEELMERYPSHCHENANCYECTLNKIRKLGEI